jgi:peptidoglycan LD-endopeptidase LytH
LRLVRLVLGLCCAVALVAAGVHTVDAQVDISDLGPSYAPQIAEAQQRADAATARFSEAQSELGRLEAEIDRTANRNAETRARLDRLRDRLRENAVSAYVRAGSGTPSVFDEDINLQVRANAMAEIVSQTETDSLDDYRAALEDFEYAEAELDRLRGRQRELVAELEASRDAMYSELDHLRGLEAARQAEIRRREEAERRRQEEIRQREAAAAAAAAARSQPRSGGGGTTRSTPSAPIASGSWICPVQGPHSFVDTWGAPRSGGRRHRGVDMMARSGTPVVAPVSGNVSHRSNRIGGLSFHLNGDDGHYYYGTHLSAYGQSGRVQAGTVIGYVGDTGNARGNPHLHFEIHPNGGSAVNPTPTVRAAC